MSLFDLVATNEKINKLYNAFQNKDSVLIEHLWNSPKALVAVLAQKATGKNILILTGASQEESRLFHDFASFTDCPVVDFPAWETMPSEHIAPSPDVVGERYQVLLEIIEKKQPTIIVSSLQACLQKLIPPESFRQMQFSLRIGQSVPFDTIIQKLESMGYQRRPVASDKSEFAIRGNIIDIFPVSSPDPYRIEFWGEEIESIRIFDPIGQKSVRAIAEIHINPAQEMELINRSEKLGSIIDYLGENTIVIFDDLLSLEDRYANLIATAGTATRTFSSIDDFLSGLDSLQKIFWPQQPIDELSEVVLLDKDRSGYYSEQAPLHKIGFELFNRKFTAKRWAGSFIPIAHYLIPELPEDADASGDEILLGLSRLPDNSDLHILCTTEQDEVGIRSRILDAGVQLPQKTEFHIAYLSSGFVLPENHLVMLPTTEITHRYKIRRQKQRSTYHTVPTQFYDLSPGEMVVHLNHGIGKYLGMEKKVNHHGVATEFFVIEYAENSKLFVPLNQAHFISKYIGSSEEIPKMHTLGSNRWKKTREATEKAIVGYAQDLLQLYAKREVTSGFIYPEDSPDVQAFEDEFPFVETEDQLSSIEAIKKDMTSDKPMERLVCGDVGYGKTEVAMRAAFKAVVDGHKQVAVLVPTTVLAMQHYENFVERMGNFPVRIGVLSRFLKPKEIKKTLEGVASGSIDILIGTHRIVSEDVRFKDLGLVIIDEEQRFGVKAKEHLKRIKVGVDSLTLSATPIPRTLYMSLIGVRDMSVINTPPQDRLPITTAITEPNDNVIKNALLRELSRDGQAYVIHNRVESIYEMASRIQKLLPQARIVVGHGQMSSEELDTVFHAFKSGRADILVATTIVENGIDIPNANTILIDRADHFGLADLYQLIGRVGRWNRRAYAYLLVKNVHRLPEISRKRLNALAESSGYGGGMKLAMRDLEIRGAGDLLGTEQSGHVSAIGFHFYCKLLKRTVQALQGKISLKIVDTKLEFSMDARLPEEYVNDTSLRMEIYQRLGEAMSVEEVDEIYHEIKDRFGPPPKPVEWLYHLNRLRVFASLHGFLLVKIDKISVTAELKTEKQPIVKKFLLKKADTPKELEEKIVYSLKKEFLI